MAWRFSTARSQPEWAAEALEATLRAAERARSQLAYEHAAYQYRAALDLLPLVPGSPVRPPDLLLDAARCEFRSGAVEEAWRTCCAAADFGRADGDGATVADAATVLRGITNSPVTGEIHALWGWWAQARELFPARSGHPRVECRDGSAAAFGNARSILLREVADGTGPEIGRKPGRR
jgi:hypothetical protein